MIATVKLFCSNQHNQHYPVGGTTVHPRSNVHSSSYSADSNLIWDKQIVATHQISHSIVKLMNKMRTIQLPVHPSAHIQALHAGQWWIREIPLRQYRDKKWISTLWEWHRHTNRQLTSDGDDMYRSNDGMRREIMELCWTTDRLPTVLIGNSEKWNKQWSNSWQAGLMSRSLIMRSGQEDHADSCSSEATKWDYDQSEPVSSWIPELR